MKAGFDNDREGPRHPPQLVFRLRPAPVLAACCDPQQQPAGARGLPALARVAARENRRPRQQIADFGLRMGWGRPKRRSAVYDDAAAPIDIAAGEGVKTYPAPRRAVK